MGTVTLYRPRGKKIWYAKWLMPDGRYKKRSLKIEDRKLAEQVKRQIEESMLKQEFGIKQSESMRYQAAWTAYEKLLPKITPAQAIQKVVWTRFFEFCGHATINKVIRADATMFMKRLVSENYAPATVNLYLLYCSRVYKALIDEELYSGSNPFAGRRVSDTGPRKMRVIAWEVIERMMDAEAGSPSYFIAALGGMLGMRKGEIDRAKWEDIDWERGEVLVRGTKTDGSLAVLPLHSALRARLEPFKRTSGYIVEYRSNGDGRYRCDMQYLWAATRKKHGIPEARLHDLRHSFATRLLALGYSMTDIAKMMRHTSTRMTERYADLRTVKVVIGDISGAAGGQAEK